MDGVGRRHCRTRTLSSQAGLSYFTGGERGNVPSCFCTVRSAVCLQSSIGQLLLIIVAMR